MFHKQRFSCTITAFLFCIIIVMTANPCLSKEIGLTEKDAVWWDANAPGLRLTATGNNESTLEMIQVGGRSAWKTVHPNTYFYFAVNDKVLYNVDTDAYLTVTYYDYKDTSFCIEYDSADTSKPMRGIFNCTELFRGTGTESWKEHTFKLDRIRFTNRENNNSDFRIMAYGTNNLAISRISLRWDDSRPVKKYVRSLGKEVTIWMGPLNTGGGLKDIADLFKKPREWQQTRSMITGIIVSDLTLDQYSDAELKSWLPELKEWNVKLGLEIGVIKDWAVTGKEAFRIGSKKWDRLQSLDGPIGRFGMDEPYYAANKCLKKPLAYAADETVDFVTAVRKRYPDAIIGDIEPYPTFSVQELIEWVDAVNKRLADRNVRRLDFLEIDPAWMTFNSGDKASWVDLKKLEDACRDRKLSFSLCYWAADYGNIRMMDLEDESTWYMSIMRQGYDYALSGGSPDEYVIQSWIGLPPRILPETDNYTFTNSVRDFIKRFIR